MIAIPRKGRCDTTQKERELDRERLAAAKATRRKATLAKYVAIRRSQEGKGSESAKERAAPMSGSTDEGGRGV
jgi:hypothetical protein